ncbi:MAG: PLDc N-terminal domain-containing protein [Bacteroidales bacterium]|nr:PLDc N-terminal domain-containing protein [Candidatus Egerieousia equi]
MMSTIIYILGVIAAVWCVLDICKKNIDTLKKVLLIVGVLVFSWIGVLVYYFLIRNRI